MSKSKMLKVALSLLLLGAVVLLMALIKGGTGTSPALAKGDAKDDVIAALPNQTELTEFKDEGKNVTSRRNGALVGADVEVFRKGDGAQFRVESVVADTEADAKALVQQAIITQIGPGPMPKGSPSKQQIGQECYNSNRGEGPPRGSIKIVARDGRAVAVVLLALPVTKDNGGKFVVPVLDDKNIALVEKHVLKVLDKLTQKGYTSKSDTPAS